MRVVIYDPYVGYTHNMLFVICFRWKDNSL